MMKSKIEDLENIYNLIELESIAKTFGYQIEIRLERLLMLKKRLKEKNLSDSTSEQIIDDFISLLQKTDLVYSQLRNDYIDKINLLQNELCKIQDY